MNQFEIWRAKPEGFSVAHYFVIISGTERCQNEKDKGSILICNELVIAFS